MELVIATNNQGKLMELQNLLPDFKLLTLKDIGFNSEIPEPYDTFHENALTKAQTVYQYCGKMTMADDSGICIDTLNGAPGVFSARFAGQNATDGQNVAKVLQSLETRNNRAAHYISVICLIINGSPEYFEGKCFGTITHELQGDGGFGYDPIFLPNGFQKTFAEMDLPLKNELSHRGEAIKEMVKFLREKL